MPDDDAPCAISIEAGFDESGVWVIDTRVSWRDGPPPPGSVLLGAARAAMLTAIDAEARRGRMLGATKVRVHMEGHDRVGVSFDDREPDPDPDRPA